MTALTIGLDFDNTIVEYQSLFVRLANELATFESPFVGSRLDLRAALRARPKGEQTWQLLQSLAYGPRIDQATLSPGVADFIGKARQAGAKVVVVSHKTEFAAAAPQGANLREAALGYMRRKGLFEAGHLVEDQVHFAATRKEKLEKIERLGCDYFVDDLTEVLLDTSFPKTTKPVLYAPGGDSADLPVATSWQVVSELIFP